MSHAIDHLIAPILDNMETLYFHDNRPWIIGYSGGKDSTLVCQLVFMMLQRLPADKRTKDIHVVSSDTLVENPIVIDYLRDTSAQMGHSAESQNLSLKTHMVQPEIEDSFWSLIIGLGYPTPEPPGFRWCTDRLKIEPSNKFIRETIHKNGEVIILLGVRKAESTARAQRIEKREIAGKLLNRHEVIEGAYVYNPITELSTDEVWKVLLDDSAVSPWGTDNKYLFELYSSSDSGECPFTLTAKIEGQEAPTCGNSRFGCWCCTMVKEDKSLNGFIASGEDWLKPLLKFRKWIMDRRQDPEFRDTKRRNGAVYTRPDGSMGFGPFTLAARQIILEELLKTEIEVNRLIDLETPLRLITDEELKMIDKMWDDEGDLTRRMLVDTYRRVYHRELPWDKYKKPVFDARVLNLLDQTFTEQKKFQEDVPLELIKKLIITVNNNKHYTHRPALQQKFDRVINEAWLHHDALLKGTTHED